MVNRVDNSNIYANSYTPGTGQRKKVDAAGVPAFLLDHDERGVVWERSRDEKTDGNETVLNDKLPRGKKDTYESHIAEPEKKDETESGNTDALIENISIFLKSLFKKILDFVWYGNDETKKEESGDNVYEEAENQEVGLSTDLEKASEEIKKSESEKSESEKSGLKKSDKRNPAFEIPVPEGTPAHNTSIITYYDRRGRIVKPDDLDTRRILFNETLEREIDAGEYGRYRKYM